MCLVFDHSVELFDILVGFLGPIRGGEALKAGPEVAFADAELSGGRALVALSALEGCMYQATLEIAHRRSVVHLGSPGIEAMTMVGLRGAGRKIARPNILAPA